MPDVPADIGCESLQIGYHRDTKINDLSAPAVRHHHVFLYGIPDDQRLKQHGEHLTTYRFEVTVYNLVDVEVMKTSSNIFCLLKVH